MASRFYLMQFDGHGSLCWLLVALFSFSAVIICLSKYVVL